MRLENGGEKLAKKGNKTRVWHFFFGLHIYHKTKNNCWHSCDCSLIILRADSASAAKVRTLEPEPFKFRRPFLLQCRHLVWGGRGSSTCERVSFWPSWNAWRTCLSRGGRKPSQMIPIPPLNHRRQAGVFRWDEIKADLKAQIRSIPDKENKRGRLREYYRQGSSYKIWIMLIASSHQSIVSQTLTHSSH